MIPRVSAGLFTVLFFVTVLSIHTLAADPGIVVVSGAIVSDQRAGSVLVYNLYSSSSTNPSAENTRINVTNSNPTQNVNVHMFFIDGRSCSVADSFICLSQSQTATLLASDIDPDVRGFIVALAVHSDGRPRDFNFLIGDEYLKLASGHIANLGAEAIPALDLSGLPTLIDFLLTIKFDGVMYGMLPRALAVDSLASIRDGNDTMLIINRVCGSLVEGLEPMGSIFGIMYDELESAFSYSFSNNVCQHRVSLSDSFPRTVPRFSTVIPAGAVGWTKFWAITDKPSLGAVINRNPGGGPSAFNAGHNLHKLTYSAKGEFQIPVFTNGCN
ncbi:MAG: hypothetical protein ACKV2V_21650 [Blastocatellia bacterium]